jgi:hypothetical protein
MHDKPLAWKARLKRTILKFLENGKTLFISTKVALNLQALALVDIVALLNWTYVSTIGKYIDLLYQTILLQKKSFTQ